MKIYQKISSTVFSAMALEFVAAAGGIAKSGSFFLFGELKCPKRLLKLNPEDNSSTHIIIYSLTGC